MESAESMNHSIWKLNAVHGQKQSAAPARRGNLQARLLCGPLRISAFSAINGKFKRRGRRENDQRFRTFRLRYASAEVSLRKYAANF